MTYLLLFLPICFLIIFVIESLKTDDLAKITIQSLKKFALYCGIMIFFCIILFLLHTL